MQLTVCVFVCEDHSPTKQCYNSVELTSAVLTATSLFVIFNVKYVYMLCFRRGECVCTSAYGPGFAAK